MNYPRSAAVAVMGAVLLVNSDAQAGDQQAISETCVSAESPKLCMESYGFKCHRIEMPGKSFEAYVIGCNQTTGSGRRRFVQLLNDDDVWTIEVDRTSDPDTVVVQADPSDSDQLLAGYLRDDMVDFYVSGNGSTNIDGVVASLHFQAGARKIGSVATVRGVCGVVFRGMLDDQMARKAQAACEPILLRAVRIRSQFTNDSPYLTAGAGDLEWQTTTISLEGDDLGLVIDGRYTFEPEGTPCRWSPDCCSPDGAIYLDSCRAPTEEEMGAIRSCLSKNVSFRTAAYFDCLTAAGVKNGCESQEDGSRLCY